MNGMLALSQGGRKLVKSFIWHLRAIPRHSSAILEILPTVYSVPGSVCSPDNLRTYYAWQLRLPGVTTLRER
jgi:hypothetical protein